MTDGADTALVGRTQSVHHALTCVIVNNHGTGINTRLWWMKFHCDFHRFSNTKSPNGGIHRERAATQRERSGLYGTSGPSLNFAV